MNEVGEIIRRSNFDLAPHTATENAFGWDTGEIAKSMSKELVVTDDMETRYFCAFHPHMKGNIKIKL
jgi:plastocyanin